MSVIVVFCMFPIHISGLCVCMRDVFSEFISEIEGSHAIYAASVSVVNCVQFACLSLHSILVNVL